jgi:hypothetical protein
MPEMWHVQYRWRLLTDYPEVIAWIPISGWLTITGQNRRIRALLMNVNDDARRSKEHIRGNRFN